MADDVGRYRLLRRGETIEATDEILDDGCEAWRPVGSNIGRGMPYDPSFFVPVRRLRAAKGEETSSDNPTVNP